MKLMKLGKTGVAMTIAAGGLIAMAAPAVAGTVLGGASVTKGARSTMDGKVIDGPVTIIIPQARGGKQFDIMAANINLPANGGGIDWHTHPGPTFGIVTGGGTLTVRSEEHTSQLQSLMRISYAVFCLKKK